jgi:DNA-binding response OmpR family regulator
MEGDDRRVAAVSERRAIFRGGRRPYDRPGQHPPVLVAEAYEAARAPCAAYLTHLHFEVAEAGRPAEALALIDAGWEPRVILADSASAVALAHRLGSARSVVPPHLIVMTSSLGEGQEPSAELLLKPFRFNLMMRVVRSALRRSAGPFATVASPFQPRQER